MRLATYAEHQGAFGVVVNAPIADETIAQIKDVVDIPVIATIVSSQMDVGKRIASGADILNVSGAAQTPEIVRKIRSEFPDIPIIATGGPTDESIMETIHARSQCYHLYAAHQWIPVCREHAALSGQIYHRGVTAVTPLLLFY